MTTLQYDSNPKPGDCITSNLTTASSQQGIINIILSDNKRIVLIRGNV